MTESLCQTLLLGIAMLGKDAVPDLVGIFHINFQFRIEPLPD